MVFDCVLFPICLEFVSELYLTVSLMTEQISVTWSMTASLGLSFTTSCLVYIFLVVDNYPYALYVIVL